MTIKRYVFKDKVGHLGVVASTANLCLVKTPAAMVYRHGCSDRDPDRRRSFCGKRKLFEEYVCSGQKSTRFRIGSDPVLLPLREREQREGFRTFSVRRNLAVPLPRANDRGHAC